MALAPSCVQEGPPVRRFGYPRHGSVGADVGDASIKLSLPASSLSTVSARAMLAAGHDERRRFRLAPAQGPRSCVASVRRACRQGRRVIKVLLGGGTPLFESSTPRSPADSAKCRPKVQEGIVCAGLRYSATFAPRGAESGRVVVTPEGVPPGQRVPVALRRNWDTDGTRALLVPHNGTSAGPIEGWYWQPSSNVTSAPADRPVGHEAHSVGRAARRQHLRSAG
jgi:hypothetical protein